MTRRKCSCAHGGTSSNTDDSVSRFVSRKGGKPSSVQTLIIDENPEETRDQCEISAQYFKELPVPNETKVENEEENTNQFVDGSDFRNSLIKSNADNPITGDLLPTAQDACILPHADSEVERKPFILNVKDVKPVKIEASCFQDVDSKSTLNFLPVIKLERNQEIEKCISEVKKELKKKYLILNIKPKPELPIKFTKVKKGLKKFIGTKELEDNHELDSFDDEQNYFSETDFASADFNNETGNYSLCEQKISNRTLFVCQKCNQCYRNRSILENHPCSKLCYSRNHKCCENCSTTFPSEEALRSRSCKKFKTKFICSKCHKVYSSKYYLEVHFNRCRGNMQNSKVRDGFQCDYCDTTFNTRKDLVIHTEVHNVEKPFTCSECGKTFWEKKLLLLHTRRHTDVFPFRCKECGKGFSQQAHLKCHMGRTHNGEKPYKCDQCDKAFVRRDILKQHKFSHTSDKPFQCSECGKSFVQKSHLNAHKKTHSNVKPYMCAVCVKCFSKDEHLKLHMRTHSGEKPYVCDHCGKGFSQNSALTVHKRVHSKVKPYECKECGARFKHSYTLRLHTRTHSNDKPYKCEKCGKRFTQNSNYHAHVRSVHEASHIHCDICGKTCSQKSNLVTHIKHVHDDRLYKCGVCKKSINSKYHFHKHVQLHISKEDIRKS